MILKEEVSFLEHLIICSRKFKAEQHRISQYMLVLFKFTMELVMIYALREKIKITKN